VDYKLDSDSDEETDNAAVLTLRARAKFERLLRQLTIERGRIAIAMAFAIDHADAAEEVRTTVCRFLLVPQTAAWPMTKTLRPCFGRSWILSRGHF
jgi:hypothetical protein